MLVLRGLHDQLAMHPKKSDCSDDKTRHQHDIHVLGFQMDADSRRDLCDYTWHADACCDARYSCSVVVYCVRLGICDHEHQSEFLPVLRFLFGDIKMQEPLIIHVPGMTLDESQHVWRGRCCTTDYGRNHGCRQGASAGTSFRANKWRTFLFLRMAAATHLSMCLLPSCASESSFMLLAYNGNRKQLDDFRTLLRTSPDAAVRRQINAELPDFA